VCGVMIVPYRMDANATDAMEGRKAAPVVTKVRISAGRSGYTIRNTSTGGRKPTP